ncbi:MAG: SRPBCC domain-containing protein [bacterium]
MTELTMDLIGDTEILFTRHFKGTPEQVYRAHTEPRLLQQWLLGPEGWSMPVCISDPRPGGHFRYEWVKGSQGFHITGEYNDVRPNSHMDHVERMFLPERTPDNHVITDFVADGTGTQMTMRMKVPDRATRDAMLATGMTTGMEASYARLDGQTVTETA